MPRCLLIRAAQEWARQVPEAATWWCSAKWWCRCASGGGTHFRTAIFPKQIPTWLPGIRSDTLQRFLELNAPDSLVEPFLGSGLAVTWISRSDIEQLGSRGGFWQEFYSRHPSATGYIELSSLGWSSDGREALAYCGHTSDSLSGSGFLVLLRYDSQRWTAIRWRQVWQS